ncbi:MAG: ribbon-helix-helix domain-containing protein [Polyangiaceae bacterium]
MPASREKVGVSLDPKELRWLKALSKRTRSSVSSLANEAIKRLRRGARSSRPSCRHTSRSYPETSASRPRPSSPRLCFPSPRLPVIPSPGSGGESGLNRKAGRRRVVAGLTALPT